MQKIEAETKPKKSMGPLARKLFTGFGKYISYNRGFILFHLARKCPAERINSTWNPSLTRPARTLSASVSGSPQL